MEIYQVAIDYVWPSLLFMPAQSHLFYYNALFYYLFYCFI